MKLCIPVTEDKGMGSPVCAHFGSAPLFLVVDTDCGDCRPIPNRNQHHGHGMCQPLLSLQGQDLDAVAVGGIGMGALTRLQAGGLRVFISREPTVAATVAALAAGTLPEASPESACAHHGTGPHGHGHDHGADGACGHGPARR